MMQPSPEQLAQAQQIGQHYRAEYEVNMVTGTFTITLIPRTQLGAQQRGQTIQSLGQQLSQQLYTFFGIEGKAERVH